MFTCLNNADDRALFLSLDAKLEDFVKDQRCPVRRQCTVFVMALPRVAFHLGVGFAASSSWLWRDWCRRKSRWSAISSKALGPPASASDSEACCTRNGLPSAAASQSADTNSEARGEHCRCVARLTVEPRAPTASAGSLANRVLRALGSSQWSEYSAPSASAASRRS